MTKLLALIAVASLAGCADTNTVTATWEWTESDEASQVGHCQASLSVWDNDTSDIIVATVHDDSGRMISRHEYNCEDAGFAIDVPAELTNVTVEVQMFWGNGLTADPKRPPEYARAYDVTFDQGLAEIGLIWF